VRIYEYEQVRRRETEDNNTAWYSESLSLAIHHDDYRRLHGFAGLDISNIQGAEILLGTETVLSGSNELCQRLLFSCL